MLIMHVIIGLGVGGAELMLRRLIESHSTNSEYKHVVVSLTSLGEVGKLLQQSDIDVIALDMKTPFGILGVLGKLIKKMKIYQPDIVQTWMYHADLIGGVAARIVGNKNIIWGIRTTDVSRGGRRTTYIVRKICAWLSSYIPKKIVCVAEASRRVHASLGYDSERMVVISNGFNLEKTDTTEDQGEAIRSECGFGPNEIIVGSVGRFNPAKDHLNFVRAVGLLASRNSNVRFLMVGRELSPSNSELIGWIELTGYANRFVLLGERDDVPACLSVMDIFCLHSRNEGFPNALGEAMAMAKACVATDVGDAALLLENSGVVVNKEDHVALAEGIELLVNMSPNERQKLGWQAKERIHSKYSMEQVRRRFESIYKSILDEK